MGIVVGILVLLFIIACIGNLCRLDKESEFEKKYGMPSNKNAIREVVIMDIDYNGIILNNDGINGFNSYLWKDKSNIYIIACPLICKDYGKIEIPISNIKYFTRMGDFYTSTVGGGSKLGGAVVGAAIAGEAGAVIGSRKNVETKIVDKRVTIMKVLDKNKNEKIIKFSSSDYDLFFKLMPEKERSLKSKDDTINNENNIDGDIQAIHKLDELRKEGILTEDEFSLKKKQILEKIH